MLTTSPRFVISSLSRSMLMHAWLLGLGRTHPPSLGSTIVGFEPSPPNPTSAEYLFIKKLLAHAPQRGACAYHFYLLTPNGSFCGARAATKFNTIIVIQPLVTLY